MQIEALIERLKGQSPTYGEPTAKKCHGEGHWFPAIKSRHGPVVLEWERFDSPSKAKAAARRTLAARALQSGGRS